MAQRRMFSLAVVDTDAFQDMPPSTQALYFHLGLHGDDDGFVSSPRKIARAAGCVEDDLKILVGKGFVIPFDSGVIVIRDWRLNNTLKNDRYKPTIYHAEMAQLATDEANRYQLVSALEPGVFQLGAGAEPQQNRTKHSSTERKKQGAEKPRTRTQFAPPSVGEVQQYAADNGLSVDADAFVNYYDARGWTMGQGNARMKNWRAAVKNWARRDAAQSKPVSDRKAIPSPDEYSDWGV